MVLHAKSIVERDRARNQLVGSVGSHGNHGSAAILQLLQLGNFGSLVLFGETKRIVAESAGGPTLTKPELTRVSDTFDDTNEKKNLDEGQRVLLDHLAVGSSPVLGLDRVSGNARSNASGENTHGCKHCHTAVLKLRLTQPVHVRVVLADITQLGQVKGVPRLVASLDAGTHHVLQSHLHDLDALGTADRGRGHESRGRAQHGNEGSSLDHFVYVY
mmetsp:Transcript_701/g.859  ORF Transcript_701/g.859 Transcript_701/m.859 type:complete len:216 (-) Transcript_701:32-679(-)